MWKNHSFDFGDPPECTCCWSNAEKRASAARRGIEPKKLKHCSSPGKHPTGDGWETMATTEIDILAEEWKGPSGRFNLAVVTGSYNNTFIVDADGPIGLENLRRLDEAGITPPTVAQISGSGGEHRIYRAPPGWDIRNNNSGEFAPKVDTRGENGQIVGPGSLHKSGNYYRWKQGCALGEIEVTEAPLELLRRVYFATKEHRT